DISAFKLFLRDARTIDDRIVTSINALRDRTSASSHAASTDTFLSRCAALRLHTQQSQASRDAFVRTCVGVVEAEVAKRKDQGESVVVAETELRMMRAELEVESILKERAARTFKERCR
ncbi:hypothetical protein HDU93_003867, partial [Gonapodya sp. JEL0774]